MWNGNWLNEGGECGVSHTTPLKFEPDKSAEEWMNGIEKRLEYEMEYYGHYHTDKKINEGDNV